MNPITVKVLNTYIKTYIERDVLLKNIIVKGEVSRLTVHRSGHVYFSLKDDESKIDCFLSRDNFAKLDFQLKEAMELIAYGNVSVYIPNGTYSLQIDLLEGTGIGQNALTLEKLKEKLKSEGLFDLKHKKNLPTFPHNIGLITSNTGAAVEDMISIIKNKNPLVKLTVYPVNVQGAFAVQDMINALAYIDKHHEEDVLIIGRGGGSPEDLAPFNDEDLARSIFNIDIPIISAVGHEIDYSIADMVADKRAETPTAAANMAVPNAYEMLEAAFNKVKNIRLNIKRELGKMELILQLAKEKLNSINPQSAIEKGYGAIVDTDGHMINSVNKLNLGDKVTILMKDGKVGVSVDKIENNR